MKQKKSNKQSFRMLTEEVVSLLADDEKISNLLDRYRNTLEQYVRLDESAKENVLNEMKKNLAAMPKDKENPKKDPRLFLESLVGYNPEESEAELEILVEDA